MSQTGLQGDVLLVVQNLQMRYGAGRKTIDAMRGVNFTIGAGEVFGLIGESGCGKTTIARAILGLVRPQEGTIRVGGVKLPPQTKAEKRRLRKAVQLVFQDPVGSLNPHMTAEQTVAEALAVHGGGPQRVCRTKARALLSRVGLAAERHGAYPHALSGGQCQRVGIARALAADPQLLVCDEPLDALDAAAQLEILELLRSLRAERKMGMLFITHQLGVARLLCDNVAVMHAGVLVETGPAARIFSDPQHVQTHKLRDAVPALGAS